MDVKYAGESAISKLISLIKGAYVKKTDIIDNCESSEADKPLSANQGKALQDQIDEVEQSLAGVSGSSGSVKKYIDDSISDLAPKTDIPTKTSDLTNDSGFITSYTETDPSVPAWAKASTKPAYTASEVGAVAYTAQSLSEGQKAQARENIGAVGTEVIDALTTLPYGGSKEWLEANGDTAQLYQIDGYIWGYIEADGWTQSSTQFLIVTSESEMTNEGGTEYLLRSGDGGTVYEYTEASGDAGVPVYDALPETANDGDIVAVDGRKYQASVTETVSGGYTNLFDASGEGYGTSGSDILTNYMPYNPYDNDGKGTLYHIKGWDDSSAANPYKFHFITDDAAKNAGWGDTSLAYCTNATSPPTVSTYDSSVKTFQHIYEPYSQGYPSTSKLYIQFLFRQDSVDNVIIAANEKIVEASTTTAITWTDIGAYTPPVEAGWNATEETHVVVDTLPASANSGETAVYSVDGYLYTYIGGSAWAQTSKYNAPTLTLTIDGELSETSTNAVQNKVVAKAMNELSERIANSSQGSDINTVSIPSYWKTAVDALTDTIKDRQADAGAKAFQFVWFSDLHGVDDYYYSDTITSRVTHIGGVAQYAAEKFNIPYVAISGDIMSQSSHGSASAVLAEYDEINKLLSPIDRDKLIYCKGNHDGAYFTASGVSYLKNVGSKAIFNAIYRRQALERNRVFGGDGSYFYVDDTASRVRFVALNCHTDGDGSINSNGYAVYNSMKTCVYGTEQLAWLAGVALNVPDGWNIILMAHQPLADTKDTTVLNGVLKAYNNRTSYNGNVDVSGDYWGDGVTGATYTNVSASVDFSTAKGKVIALFAGHRHRDLVWTSADYGYACPVIAITTAGGDVRDSGVTRVVGTATETAMDIVTVDLENNLIYCDRLGAGTSRAFDFNGNTVVD